MPTFRPAALVALVCLLMNSPSLAFYKWTDANGKVHYSDAPPVQNSGSTTRLNKQGLAVQSTEAEQAKRARVARDKALAAQQAEQAKADAKQKREDDALLTSFASIADIDRLANRQVELLQGDLRLLIAQRTDAVKQVNLLSKQQERWTKRNKPVPADISQALMSAQLAVPKIDALSAQKQQEIIEVKLKAEKNKARLSALLKK